MRVGEIFRDVPVGFIELLVISPDWVIQFSHLQTWQNPKVPKNRFLINDLKNLIYFKV